MGKALYRKYRSKKLPEIVGQPHITDTLSRALANGTFSHAYLFTGPRGTGKTSIARILAHEVNGLTYQNDESSHLDIIEIDAASNRRIDEIRELRERVHIAPTSATYKVYIIDEVHMLTKEAFNALLKTLEEPPAHVIFILATTEAHKLPETIISRTQRFTFKPVDIPTVVEHLRRIATQEHIQIDDDALDLIAGHGEGSFRDSISLLDQMRHAAEKIGLEDVQRTLGQAPASLLADILRALDSGQISSLHAVLATAREYGTQAPQLAKQLSAALRRELLTDQPAIEPVRLLTLLKQLAIVPGARDPSSALEIALFESVLAKTVSTQGPKLAATPAPKRPQIPVTPASKTPEPERADEAGVESLDSLDAGGQSDEQRWPVIVQAVKHKHNTLYSIVRMAVPDFQDNKLVLKFTFPFHQKRLNDAKNKQLLMGIVHEVTGQRLELEAIVEKNVQRPKLSAVKTRPAESDETLATINNIFGEAEVLE